MKNFGKFIRRVRKSKNLTLTKVQTLSHNNISSQYLSLLENGNIASPDLEKIKLLGHIYNLESIIFLFCCYVGFDKSIGQSKEMDLLVDNRVPDDVLLKDFVIEYTKNPLSEKLSSTGSFSESKRSLLKYLFSIYKSMNQDAQNCECTNPREILRRYLSDEFDKKLEDDLYTITASSILESATYLIVTLKLLDEGDYHKLKNLEDWFKRIRKSKITTDRYIIIGDKFLKKHYSELIEFIKEYFSYPGLRLYLIKEADIKNEKFMKDIGKFIIENKKIIYQFENKEKFLFAWEKDLDAKKKKVYDETISELQKKGSLLLGQVVSNNLKDMLVIS